MPDFKVKAAIFDLDGTLIDSMWVWNKIDNAFLSKRGHAPTREYTDALSALSMRETAIYTKNYFGLMESIEEIMDEWLEMAKYEYSHVIKLKPHAKEYLLRLKDMGFKLGVATALSQPLHLPVLKNNLIAEIFDCICSTDEVGVGKRDPAVFLAAASRMSVLPEECMVFDDSHEALKSAKSVGMKVFGVYDEAAADIFEKIKLNSDGVVYDFRHAPYAQEDSTEIQYSRKK